MSAIRLILCPEPVLVLGIVTVFVHKHHGVGREIFVRRLVYSTDSGIGGHVIGLHDDRRAPSVNRDVLPCKLCWIEPCGSVPSKACTLIRSRTRQAARNEHAPEFRGQNHILLLAIGDPRRLIGRFRPRSP